MKKILILNLVLYISFSCFSQWIGQKPPLTFIGSLYFTDSLTGHAVGTDYYINAGIIAKTTDGGSTWITTLLDTINVSYRDIYFPTTDTGYAVGGYGKIVKTVDGGDTWMDASTDTALTYWFIDCPSANHCYAACRQRVIIETEDGGANWQIVHDEWAEFYAIDFVTDDIGFAVGTETKKTVDGGSNWTVVDNSPNTNVHFFNQDIGYSIAVIDTIRKTIDGGNTWEDISTGLNQWQEGIFVLDENLVYIACSTQIPSYDMRIICSNDGGITWNLQSNNDSLGAYGIFFTDYNNGWVYGTPNLNSIHVYHTTTGGNCNNVSVQELALLNKEINIYPNPTNDVIFIDYPFEFEFFIIDCNGLVLLSGSNEKGTKKVDISSMKKGLYFAKIVCDNNVYVMKIIRL